MATLPLLRPPLLVHTLTLSISSAVPPVFNNCALNKCLLSDDECGGSLLIDHQWVLRLHLVAVCNEMW